jgi:hypothetical protein
MAQKMVIQQFHKNLAALQNENLNVLLLLNIF